MAAPPVASERGSAQRPPCIIEELVPQPDPLDAADRLLDLPYLLLLDSAADPERLGRFTFLTADPATVVTAKDGRTVVLERTAIGTDDGTGVVVDGDPLLIVRTLLAPYRVAPDPALPPFQGGAAGYIGYGYGASLEHLPRPRYDDLQIPDVVLGLYDWVLAWDHETHQAWFIASGAPEIDEVRRTQRARQRRDDICRRLAGRTPRIRDAAGLTRSGDREGMVDGNTGRGMGEAWPRPYAPLRPPTFPVPDHPRLRSSFSRDAYLDAVRRVREYIVAGDIFQANLSQRFEGPYDDDPLTLYRRLRALNPAPFAAYFQTPDLAVLSASPERFIRVDPSGAVETRPIKGTTPRGIGPEHDAHLGRALTESEKDRAENLMIVDLLRNDLSRVCQPGTVRVPELFALEHYSTVHHLVSTVVGQLAPEADVIDLLWATFPGGSITGAPKVRAMEIIAELEPSQRGVYCGAIGYLSGTGAADTSIVIRTYLVRQGRASFSAGGGIVADSDPASEYRETLDKARSLISALEDAWSS